MKKISGWIGRYMALIVLAVAALALFVPKSCLWIQTSWVNYLLMVVMFGMGLTLQFDDFAAVFRHPKDVLIGCAAQFTIMPLLAFVLGKVFGLEAGLLTGVILVERFDCFMDRFDRARMCGSELSYFSEHA